MAEVLQNNSVNITNIGMDLDSLPENIRQGFYRYALNVTNTNSDNLFALTNENKFVSKDGISFQGMTIIGKSFITDNDFLFVTVDNNITTHFIVYDIENNNKKKDIVVSEPLFDKLSTVDVIVIEKLGVYYAYIGGQSKKIVKIDVYNSPNTVTLNDITLDREFTFPELSFSVTNGGNLPVGSYSITIRYLDSDYNATNWILSYNTINIAQSDENIELNRFIGYSNSNKDYDKKTNKSIIVDINKIDTNYKYYQLGIITSTEGINAPDTIYITERIPIEQTKYHIATLSKYIKGDVSEVIFNKVSIDGVKSLDVYTDRLVAANIRYKDTDSRDYQLLASAIKSEVQYKAISLNDSDTGYSSKNEYYLGGGFMPGEVYAFGIVYVFDDGSVSQVYHIPSPNNNYGFKPYLLNQVYDDWYGTDYDGNSLIGTNVRLHQFPFRDEIGLYNIIDRYIVSAKDERELVKEVDHIYNAQLMLEDTETGLTYSTAANIASFKQTVIYNDPNPDTYLIEVTLSYQPVNSATVITNISYDIEYKDGSTDSVSTNSFAFFRTKLSSLIGASIAGVKFSNIQLPQGAVGYIIVYDKKSESNRHIIDYGYANPLHRDDFSTTLMYTYLDNKYSKNLDKSYIAIHSPVYNYRKLQTKPDKIRLVAVAKAIRTIDEKNIVDNVTDGTSSEGLFYGLIKDDNDGVDYNLSVVYNDSIDYDTTDSGSEYNVEDVFYIRQAEKIEYDNKTIRNLSIDDQVIVAKLTSDISYTVTSSTSQGTLLYVALINNDIGYTSLEQISYIPLGYFENDSCEIYRSDIYLSAWTLSSSVYNGMYSSEDRKIWESVSNITAHIINLGVDTAQILAGIASGNIAAVYSGVVNSIKEIIGGSIESYKMLYELFDEDESYHGYSYHGAVSMPSFVDDTVRFTAETFVSLPIESRYNNQLRVLSLDDSSYFTGYNISQYKEYIKKKHLFSDSGRDLDTSGNARTLTLRFVTIPELYLYDESYLRVNDYKVFSQFNGENITDFPNRIVWSQVWNSEAKTDGFSNFLPLNYKDIEEDITAIKSYNNQLLVWTKKKLFKFPRPFQEKLTDEMQIYIGTGSFLSIGPMETIDDDIQSYGTIYPNTIIKFKGLLAFVNTEGYPILIAGNNISNISDRGIKKWLSKNRNIKFENIYGGNYPIDNPYHEYGIGYILGYDNINNRLLFTQKDFYFNDQNWYYDSTLQTIVGNTTEAVYNGFTLSFSLLSDTWISFHDYMPNIYVWNYNIFCFINSYNFFMYDTNYYNNNFVIELISRKDPLQNKVWEDVKMNIDVYENGRKVYDRFFDYIVLYTEDQISLHHAINLLQDSNDILHTKISNTYEVKVENIEDTWRVNNIRDYRTDTTIPVVYDSNIRYRVKEFNYGNQNKIWKNVNPIRNNYVIIRLERVDNNDNFSKFVTNTFISKYTVSI